MARKSKRVLSAVLAAAIGMSGWPALPAWNTAAAASMGGGGKRRGS
ncbi:hypothetical protein [Cohnella rhizosphaerae]|uniref:Uncharacterized protein n=1 Tax=Cohnella rhizosphaerae TaxID=1457232 RepID=A0A9X4KYM9_9BACL|nr:hypothetical protein [Cohnella rhizosphaerae]MDG0810247.1 hypothetical protein [Cohnella rhizosphaerae]